MRGIVKVWVETGKDLPCWEISKSCSSDTSLKVWVWEGWTLFSILVTVPASPKKLTRAAWAKAAL